MYSPLATPAATRKVLDEFGLSTKKSLGQNFLINDDIIRKIVELSALGGVKLNSQKLGEVSLSNQETKVIAQNPSETVQQTDQAAQYPAQTVQQSAQTAQHPIQVAPHHAKTVQQPIQTAQSPTSEHVLEVGPGIGTLTLALLPRAAHVTSVERDDRLLPVLATTTASWANKFTLIHKDALNLTLADFGSANLGNSDGASLGNSNCANAGVTKFAAASGTSTSAGTSISTSASTRAGASTSGVAGAESAATVATANVPASNLPTTFIANLPYAVAATLILGYFQNFPSINSATVMVQREVADRISAQPGNKNYGAYTVKLGMYAKVTGKFNVGPNNFFPPPHVESAVVRLDRATPKDAHGRPLTPAEIQTVCKVADAAFFNRRKTIANSMKSYFAATAETPAVTASASEATVASVTAETPAASPATNGVASTSEPAPIGKFCTTAPSVSEMLSAANINPRRRGETLSPEDFISLALTMSS